MSYDAVGNLTHVTTAIPNTTDPTEYGTNVVPGWDVDDNLVSYTIGSGTVMTADYGPDGLRAWKQTGVTNHQLCLTYLLTERRR